MDTEFASALPLGDQRLIPGVEYRVVAQFRDDAGVNHPIGERWVFMGFESPRLYPGRVLHVRDERGHEVTFRLKQGSGEQDLFVHGHLFLAGPDVQTGRLLNHLSTEAWLALERVRHRLPNPLPLASEDLLKQLRGTASNARSAYDKGMDEELELAADLERVATALERGLKNYRA